MIPVFPTTYFGSIAYFKELCRYEKVSIEVMETYPKQTLRNRTLINTANGHLRLTVPVEKPHGSKSLTGTINVSDKSKWRSEHWRAIKSAYSSAPYFDHYGMEIEELLNLDFTNLVAYNTVLTQRILKWLDIEVELTSTDEFIFSPEKDYRYSFDKIEESKPTYIQVFNEDPFTDSLSIIDAIFCEGPLARNLLLP